MRTLKTILIALPLLLIPAILVKRYLIHPNPADILAATVERYEGLTFYSDTTSVRSDMRSVEGSYQLSYARPARLRVQFRGLLDDELVVADGTTLYVYRPSVNQYRATPAPQQLPDELPGGQPMLTLSLLNGTMPLQSLGAARYEGRRKWRGQRMHVVRVEGEGGRAAQSGIAGMVLWVGAEDPLIHRSDITLAVGDETVTQSLVHSDVSTRPPPAGTFAFRPPPGARAVARFRAPEILSGSDAKGAASAQDGQGAGGP